MGFDLWILDQTNQTTVDALIQKVKAKYGKIDLLFLNAGEHDYRGAWFGAACCRERWVNELDCPVVRPSVLILLYLHVGRGAGEPMFSETNLGPLGTTGYSECNMLKVRTYQIWATCAGPSDWS